MSEEATTTQGTGIGEQIAELAKRINGYAVRKGWSKARLCREKPQLGSERTYRDMLAGRCDGYDAEGRLIALRAVWAEVEELAGPGETEAVYDDLSPISHVGNACLGAMRNWGINRVVIVLGEPGMGKTTAARRLAARYAERVVWVEATDVWGDKPGPLIREILKQLGESYPPASAALALDLLVKKLSVTRRLVAIDEAHHLGPRCLNTVKTLVNQTPGEFVLLAIPSLWAKLSRTAYTEARQISTNRLAELVQLDLEEPDIARYLRHRIGALDLKTSREAARIIRAPAAGNGNMSFVRDVADALASEDEITPKAVLEAAQTELAKRVERLSR